MPTRKLGLLLSTAPSHSSVDIVAKLADAAVRQGIEVYLYLIDEGVKSLKDARFRALIESGIKMSVCAYGCQQHGVPTRKSTPVSPSPVSWFFQELSMAVIAFSRSRNRTYSKVPLYA
jgi:predicted peroxiredoxin